MSIKRVAALSGLVCGAVIDARTGSLIERVGGMSSEELGVRATLLQQRSAVLLEECGDVEDFVFSDATAHHLVIFERDGAHLFYAAVKSEEANLAMVRFALESLAKEYGNA